MDSLAEYARVLSDRRIEHVFKEVEANFRRTIEGHVTYHSYLEQEALNAKDSIRANYHSIRREVYQQILDNYSLSNIYCKR